MTYNRYSATVQHESPEKFYFTLFSHEYVDRDLAAMYGVETKVLNQAVKRNLKRFEGDDFMFRLTKDETQQITLRSHFVTLETPLNTEESNDYSCLRSQFVTLNNGRGQHSKYLPYAFTELGVAMLSSV